MNTNSFKRNKMKLNKSINQPKATRMLRFLIATTSLCTILLLGLIIFGPTLSIRAANTSPNTSSTSTNTNQTAPLQSNSKTTATTTTTTALQTNSKIGNDSSKSNTKTKSSSSSSSSSSSGGGDQNTIAEPQQQSTDLSSMYVQIPIAEPGDTGTQDGVQNTLTGNEADGNGGDPSKATSWTGPWPKKFQIGYIKQSDLHQVLIESLKNDPFVSLTSPVVGMQSATKTTTPSTPSPAISKSSPSQSVSSDSATLMAPQPQTQPQSQQKSIPTTPQWPTPAAMQSPNYQRQQQQPQQQYPPRPQQNLNNNKNVYHHQNMMKQVFLQEPKSLQPPFSTMNRFQQMNQFNQQQPRNFVNHHQQQQHPKLISMTGNFHQQNQQQLAPQRHQFQFGGFPSNAFKNQPIYTINNYPHHEQMVDPTMIVIPNGGQPQYSNNIVAHQTVSAAPRPQKSSDYYSSWKPVTSEKSEPTITTSGNKFNVGNNGQFQTDYQSLNDGFDDGFNSPSSGKDSSSSSQSSMNRHPMLNTYLSNNSATSNDQQQQQRQALSGSNKTTTTTTTSANKVVSPAMKIKQQLQGETKSASTKGGIKSGDSSSSSTKSAQGSQAVKGSLGDSSMELSGSRRRAQNGTTTASTTTPSSSMTTKSTIDNNSTTSTTSSTSGIADSDSATASTTMSPLQSTTQTATSSSITTTTIESETQEPDSEVIDSDTTEPSTATTTVTSASTSPTTMAGSNNNSTTSAQNDQQDGNSQGSVSSTATSLDSSSTTNGSQSPPTPSTGQQQQPQQQQSMTSTSDNGESEVVTQGAIQQQSSGTVSLPSVPSANGGGVGGGQQTVSDENGGFSQASVQRGSSATPSSTAATMVQTTTSSSTASSGNSREETTPSTGESNDNNDGNSTNRNEPKTLINNGEVEDSDSNNEAKSASITNKRSSSNRDTTNLDSMSDEALLAASVKTGSDIAKNEAMQAMNLQRQRAKAVGSTTSKRTRSSERLQQQQQQVNSNSNSGRKGGSSSGGNKLITKKPNLNNSSNRSGKQVSVDSAVKGAKLSNSRGKSVGQNKKRPTNKSTNSSLSQKSTRMVNQQQQQQQSEKLIQQQQQQPQVVSMSAAQAQSTAQTLASLLLSRCMNSANCAHLLDICTTKQAIIPLMNASSSNNNIDISSTSSSSSSNNNITTGWSMPVGLMSSTIMSLTQSLQADKVLKVFPQWKDAIENVVDHDTQSGYTLILPSNEAIERLPEATIDSWLANSDLMAQIIDNHMIDSSELIEFNNGGINSNRGVSTTSNSQLAAKTRVIRSKGLQINQHRDKMVTINGKRVVYANQAAPSGGRIHVIDGVLDWPIGGGFAQAKLLDIMDTLKQCDKFDGFVTLAEGTGLTQILKQDHPMTVFVPSNEALRKIPDEELEVIKNNSTALKEFLMYHVVNGSYFSQDLRDGQQLASIFDMKPIQVGVRVDGCSRRLVEANTSPMRRPDIVAKNGVIHILDWYLTVRDNEWCDPISRTELSTNSVSSRIPPSSTSERLQQLATDQSLGQQAVGYATRMTMPANHKPASLIPANHQYHHSQSVSPNSLISVASSITGGLETNNIIVSASPLADINRAASAKA